jgi:hypothetical protein
MLDGCGNVDRESRAAIVAGATAERDEKSTIADRMLSAAAPSMGAANGH